MFARRVFLSVVLLLCMPAIAPAKDVTFRVVDETDTALPGITVYAAAENQVLQTLTTDADGRVTVTASDPRTISVRVCLPGYHDAYASGSDQQEVVEVRTRPILSPSFNLHFIDEDGKPAVGVQLEVEYRDPRPKMPEGSKSTKNADGTITTTTPVGFHTPDVSYYIVAAAPCPFQLPVKRTAFSDSAGNILLEHLVMAPHKVRILFDPAVGWVESSIPYAVYEEGSVPIKETLPVGRAATLSGTIALDGPARMYKKIQLRPAPARWIYERKIPITIDSAGKIIPPKDVLQAGDYTLEIMQEYVPLLRIPLHLNRGSNVISVKTPPWGTLEVSRADGKDLPAAMLGNLRHSARGAWGLSKACPKDDKTVVFDGLAAGEVEVRFRDPLSGWDKVKAMILVGKTTKLVVRSKPGTNVTLDWSAPPELAGKKSSAPSLRYSGYEPASVEDLGEGRYKSVIANLPPGKQMLILGMYGKDTGSYEACKRLTLTEPGTIHVTLTPKKSDTTSSILATLSANRPMPEDAEFLNPFEKCDSCQPYPYSHRRSKDGMLFTGARPGKCMMVFMSPSLGWDVQQMDIQSGKRLDLVFNPKPGGTIALNLPPRWKGLPGSYIVSFTSEEYGYGPYLTLVGAPKAIKNMPPGVWTVYVSHSANGATQHIGRTTVTVSGTQTVTANIPDQSGKVVSRDE